MLFLAAQIFLWIAISFVIGALLGFWYGRSSSFMLDDTSFTPRQDANGGSVKVLSDSLLETQRELKDCQQSLVVAESRLKDMEVRFKKKDPSEADLESKAHDRGSIQMDVSPRHAIEADALIDDLTLIHGIGPFIQSKLQEMNISTYKKIANLSEEDIHLIETTINYFPGRIYRDGWMESARILHEKKYGEMV